MTSILDPVLRAGSSDSNAPLVVLLHGRGFDEHNLMGMVDRLPQELAYAALRGPISLAEGGYTWFDNEGLGRPVPASLTASIAHLTRWLTREAPGDRPVVPVGWSAGGLIGGGLVLSQPPRFAGFALLMGALPLSAGLPLDGQPWVGLPVLAVHGDADDVMPAELMTRTWQWLHEESGATISSQRVPGGHDIGDDTIDLLAAWLTREFV